MRFLKSNYFQFMQSRTISYLCKVELFPIYAKSNYFLSLQSRTISHFCKIESNYFLFMQSRTISSYVKVELFPVSAVEPFPKWFKSVELFPILENRTISSF